MMRWQARWGASGDAARDEEAAACFAAAQESLGQQLSALETPDQLVVFFTSLANSLISQCTSAPAQEEGQGADASSMLGLYLRSCFARFSTMPFEVRQEEHCHQHWRCKAVCA
jgi:hypothetical protein